MKMRELIDRVSDLYRNEREKQKSLSQELYEVQARLWDAENDDFENISYAEYGRLIDGISRLEKEVEYKEQYCEGIFKARELLMDLCFETDIETK